MTRLLLLLGAASLALFGALAWLSETVLKPHAGGLAPFDTRVFGYAPAEALIYLQALDATGRATYLTGMRVLDSLFPPVLALFAGLVALRLTRSLMLWSRVVLLVPVAGYAMMDLCENALVAEMLRGGEAAFDPGTARLASEFTVTKWVLLAVSAGMLAILALRRRDGLR